MSKSSNPPGKGKTSLSTTIPNDVLEALDYLASESGLTRSNYARQILIETVKSGRTLSSRDIMRRERYNTPEVLALRAAEKPILPTPRRSAGA